MYNFDEIIDRRGTNAIKLERCKTLFGTEDVLPLWVADMDFKNRHLKAQQEQHAASLGETARHHQAMEGLKERELTPGMGKLTPTDRKAQREAIANLRRAKGMKKELGDLVVLATEKIINEKINDSKDKKIISDIIK